MHTDHDDPSMVEVLEAILERKPRYLGIMGSRRHTGHHLEALRARGMAEEKVAAIQSPVGIDIGSRSPEEIALSILAGVTALRRGAAAGWMDKTTDRG